MSVQAYLKMDQYASQFHNGTKSWSGAWGSGSGAQYYGLNPNQRVLIVTGAPSIGLNDTARTVSFTATAYHFHGTTSSTLSVTLPAKVPSPPTGLTVTRISDSSHRLDWTRGSTYTSVRLERRTNGGAWQHISSVSSNAATMTDTTTKANNRYEYRVRGANAGGTSGWSGTSATVFTTPGVPSVPSVTRVGNDIRISTSLPPIATHTDIQDDGVTVAAALARGLLPWTHTDPDTLVTHRYRSRSRVNSGTTNNVLLTSAYSAYSVTVQLTAPPNAPSRLAPNGALVSADERVTLRFQHNPVDSSDLRAMQFRYRAPGGAWEEATLTTSVWNGSYQVTQSRWNSMKAVGHTIEWQARTRGTHPEYGAWSATAVMTVATPPTAAIESPLGGNFHEAVMTVGWAYFQAEGLEQTGWRARLLREGQVIETRSDVGGSSTTFTTGLIDGSSYAIEVEVSTGDVWSQPETVEINVSFIPPLPGFAEGVWNEQTGALDLEIFVRNDESYDVIVEPSGALAVEV